MRLIKFGKYHINPDHVVVVSREGDGRVLIKLSTGEVLDSESGVESSVINALVGGGPPA